MLHRFSDEQKRKKMSQWDKVTSVSRASSVFSSLCCVEEVWKSDRVACHSEQTWKFETLSNEENVWQNTTQGMKSLLSCTLYFYTHLISRRDVMLQKYFFTQVLQCPIKMRVFHQNESCLACPHPPSSYGGRREQEGSSHFDEKLSFW